MIDPNFKTGVQYSRKPATISLYWGASASLNVLYILRPSDPTAFSRIAIILTSSGLSFFSLEKPVHKSDFLFDFWPNNDSLLNSASFGPNVKSVG